MVDKPYFMKDEAWYYFDVEEKTYVLTDEAPQEAKKSYDQWMKDVEEENKVVDDR